MTPFVTSPLASPFSPDLSGLLCAFRFRPGSAAAPLDADEADAWLRESGRRPGEFLWLHFNLAHAGTEKWLRRHLALSEVFYETLHEGMRSTRIDYADDSLVAVLNDVLFDFSFDASDIATLWLSVGSQVVVTARSRPLRSVDLLREDIRHGRAVLQSPVDLLIHLLRDEADVLIGIVRDLAAKVDSIEDRLLADRPQDSRSQLGAYRRLLVRLQRLLAPEPSALFRLLNRPPSWIADSDVLDLRQSTEEFSSVLSDMAALQERIKLLQEEIAAQINEQTNRSVFLLTTVSVLALPINIIAGLFGMNVGGIPFSQGHEGFWVVVAIVASFTVVAGLLAFRQRGEAE